MSRPLSNFAFNCNLRRYTVGYLPAVFRPGRDKPTLGIILALSLHKWDLDVVGPLMGFLATSLMKLRFWIILCPVSFIGNIQGMVGDMAQKFRQEGMEEMAAGAYTGTLFGSTSDYEQSSFHRLLYA
jgi:hypothetical protein